MTWAEATFWVFILALLFSPWDRIWNKLLGNSADDDEEKEMPYNIDPTNCDEGELLKAKTECLQLATTGDKTPDQIVADAQKFWDFLSKTDEETAD